MSRKPLLHIQRAAAPNTGPDLSPLESYRFAVVELPWPDFLNRRVLIAIDWRGKIFDQSAACSDEEVQRIANRMIDDMESARERLHRDVKIVAMGDASGSASTSSASS